MDITLKELLTEVEATLELYGEESRYLELECAATGLTLAQDEAGEKAREMLEKVQEFKELLRDQDEN